MTNIDRAADVIAKASSYGEATVDRYDMEVVQALADAERMGA